MMKKLKYLLLLCLFTTYCYSQTFEKDMELVYKNFVSVNKIAYNIKYVLKENHNENSKIISQNTGRYVKSKNKVISQYDTKFTFSSPNEIVMVDKDEKYMRIKKTVEEKKNDPDFLAQLKEYNKGIEKVTRLTTNKKDVITYNVQLKNNPIYGISRYEISINTKTFLMEQMTLFYKNPLKKDPQNNIAGTEVPRLEIIFSDFNAQKVYSESELESAFYYTRENKKLLPSANFKNYDVKEIF